MHITLPPRPRSRVSAAIIELAWPLIFLLIIIAFTIPFFLIKTTRLQRNDKPRCLANGNPIFPWNATVNEYWSPSTALYITLGHGQYTYPEAKAIDVMWDLLVGRGGQILAAIWTYYVVRKSMLFTMEQQDVAIPIAYSVYFDKLGYGLLGSIIRNLTHGRMRNSKAIPAWRLLGWLSLVIYVISYPTIMAAMTGYQTTGSVYFHPAGASGGSFAPAGGITPNLPFTVRDGSRMGLHDGVTFTTPDIKPFFGGGIRTTNDTYNTVLSYYFAIQNALANTTYTLPAEEAMSTFTQARGDSMPSGNGSYTPIWAYCTISQSGGNTCEDNTLVRPVVPADAPYIPTAEYTWSNITLYNQTYILQPPPLDIVVTGPADSWSVVLSDDGSYGGYFSNASIAQGAVCLPVAQYQWGFSAALLLLFCIFTTLFGAVMLVLQWEVYFYSRANRFDVGLDGYRDAARIVHALKEESGDDIVEDNSQRLREKLKCYSGALSIETSNLPTARMGRRRLNRVRTEDTKGIPLLEREDTTATGTTHETVKHDSASDDVVR
ncbi:hypothetical protein LTR86_007680 [Recurvomyces mirabilis]|nr:hypothetical protein LTR86_007680 [Recurvomyces mirabilis]